MDNLVDLFSGDAFSALSLSTAINMVPNQYGRVNELGLFADRGISTTAAAVEIDNGVLNLITATPRGTAAPKNKTGKRELKYFNIPRLALDDMIYPSDIQNVRAFGSLGLKTPESVTNDKLIALSRKHDITREYLKCGALAGVIKDADDTTILNLYTEFGIEQKVVSFALDTDATKIQQKAAEVAGHIEDNLMGDTMSHVMALCSPGFFQGLISHPKIRDAYQYYMNMQATALAARPDGAGNPLRDDVRKGFLWQNIWWEEYRAKAPVFKTDGTTEIRNFIAENEARFFPVGTTETFYNFDAPADWMETVNTVGLPKYGKVVPENGGRWVEVLSQSNPLPLCLRPGVLVKGTKA